MAAEKTKKIKKSKKAKSPAKTKQAMEPVDFEKALEQLNDLAATMERGNLPLEQSLKHFENGIGIIRKCQKALTDAEQRVQILTEHSDSLTSFETDDSR